MQACLVDHFDVVKAVLTASPAKVPRPRVLWAALDKLDLDNNRKLSGCRMHECWHVLCDVLLCADRQAFLNTLSELSFCFGTCMPTDVGRLTARRKGQLTSSQWEKDEGDKLRMFVSYVRKLRRKSGTKSRPSTELKMCICSDCLGICLGMCAQPSCKSQRVQCASVNCPEV